ncbi:MAG: hypothetical protein WCA20_18420 [Candidatus Sulfotelmatobacter sp.]
MKKYKIAVLDDYQNVAIESAAWSLLRDRADIAVFHDHLADPDAVIERLLPPDILLLGISWLRSSQTVTSATKPKTFPFVLTVALARLTALRAATIEPTIQKLTSKGRALKPRPPNNSTVLSSMRISLRL